jgi:hypothetical protein
MKPTPTAFSTGFTPVYNHNNILNDDDEKNIHINKQGLSTPPAKTSCSA